METVSIFVSVYKLDPQCDTVNFSTQRVLALLKLPSEFMGYYTSGKGSSHGYSSMVILLQVTEKVEKAKGLVDDRFVQLIHNDSSVILQFYHFSLRLATGSPVGR